MKINNLQEIIDHKIIENGKNEIKAINANESLCGIEVIHPNKSITVGSFAENMLEFISSTNLGEDNVTKLLKIIQDHFPFSNIPLKQTSFGNWKSTLCDYEKINIAILEVDVCPNNCMVFTGQYLNDWYCKNCNAKRFTNCKYCSKSFNSYQYECPHNTRIPFKKLKYRSIKSIICNLIRYDFFRFLINYTYYDMNKYINSDLKHWDIKDSEIYKKNYDEMKIYFNKQYDNIENKPIMYIITVL